MTRDKLFDGERICFVDQYDHVAFAHSLAALIQIVRHKYGISGRVAKVYRDMPEGKVVWVGYVISTSWFIAHEAVRVPS